MRHLMHYVRSTAPACLPSAEVQCRPWRPGEGRWDPQDVALHILWAPRQHEQTGQGRKEKQEGNDKMVRQCSMRCTKVIYAKCFFFQRTCFLLPEYWDLDWLSKHISCFWSFLASWLPQISGCSDQVWFLKSMKQILCIYSVVTLYYIIRSVLQQALNKGRASVVWKSIGNS